MSLSNAESFSVCLAIFPSVFWTWHLVSAYLRMCVFWGAEKLRQQRMDVQYLLLRNQESKRVLLERRGFWTMNHSLLLHDTKGLNVLSQDFFCASASFLIKARQTFQIYTRMYKWQNVRMKILAFKFNSAILFGLNCLKGKKKVTPVSIVTHSFNVFLTGCIVYQNSAGRRAIHFVPSDHRNIIHITGVMMLFLRQSTCKK